MPSFEKQPDKQQPDYAPVWIGIFCVWSLLMYILGASMSGKTSIVVPPLPANYAVLATDGKGHLFWLEPVNSPFPGGKQP